MAGLVLEKVTKRFGETVVLQGVSFEVEEGEVVAVLGPSGCGKSTLLSLIAGLEPVSGGRVFWEGQDIGDVPPHERGFGLMFQDYALFPHKDVFENVAFGLRMAGLGKEEISGRVDEVLGLVGLAAFGARDVISLSGGEQQRVALARSLSPRPKLLMLDEPLGSLDKALREQLLDELQEILRQAGQTTLYITHDQEEAFTLADLVVVMREGQVAQIGTPQEIYREPNSEFVARFVGLENIVVGEAQGGIVNTVVGKIPYKGVNGQVKVLIRPDGARLGGGGDFELVGEVIENTFRGGMRRLRVMVNGFGLSFVFGSGVDLPEVGEEVRLGIDGERGVWVFVD